MRTRWKRRKTRSERDDVFQLLPCPPLLGGSVSSPLTGICLFYIDLAGNAQPKGLPATK